MYNLVCAFEVVEHFANPKREMAHIFERSQLDRYYRNGNLPGAGCRLVGLAAVGGQHVFFYTQNAMASLAATHGYHYKPMGHMTYFLSVHLHGLRALYCRRSFHLA